MVAPDRLRPSPFDGMRMLYTEDADEVLEVSMVVYEGTRRHCQTILRLSIQ